MAIHLIGLFHDPDSALAAAGKLKGVGFETPEILSPIPIHGVEEVLGKKKSVIKRFTLIGAITGGTTGFLLAAITAVMFPHPTGGRPIITIPPNLVGFLSADTWRGFRLHVARPRCGSMKTCFPATAGCFPCPTAGPTWALES